MPDHLTTANALTSGEIDLVEQFPYDLLPMLEGDAGIKVEPATSSRLLDVSLQLPASAVQ